MLPPVHPLRFLHDTCQIDMVCARKFVHFDFVLQLESHAELNTKTTLVVITRAKGTVYSRGKKSRPLVSTKIKYVTDGHPKRITKSGQNHLKIDHCALNHEYLSKFCFSWNSILNEVRSVKLRGEAFPALFFLFFLIVWVGFTKMETPRDVADSVFDLWTVSSSFFFFNRRKFDLVNIKGSRMPPSKVAG